MSLKEHLTRAITTRPNQRIANGEIPTRKNGKAYSWISFSHARNNRMYHYHQQPSLRVYGDGTISIGKSLFLDSFWLV